MKRMILNISKPGIKFAIRKTTCGDKIIHHPVAKTKGLLSDWIPIVLIYPNTYVLLPFEVQGLTEQDCKDHIVGYKAQLAKSEAEVEFKQEYIEYK